MREDLRAEPATLRHGDINLWNIIVEPWSAALTDWDDAAVGSPTREPALFQQHVRLFTGGGLPVAFFDGYGRIFRRELLQTYETVESVCWLASEDWAAYRQHPALSKFRDEFFARLRGYIATLAGTAAGPATRRTVESSGPPRAPLQKQLSGRPCRR